MGSCISVEVDKKDGSAKKPQPSQDASTKSKQSPKSSEIATAPVRANDSGNKVANNSGGAAAPAPAVPGSVAPILPPAKKLKIKDLITATNNFDENLVLGEGSFGKVYRGLIDDGTGSQAGSGRGANGDAKGLSVAVKKLNPESFQGYEEWLAEVLLLDKLRHPNLVRLIGYCADRGEAMLVYELCEHGSLDSALFEPKDKDHILTWEQRVRIALDSARGLAYLHQNNVIHRDFKASNILIAGDYSARLTDFGMARAGPDGNETHISTRVMGTMGYLDPTYMETGRLTKKSDVYAFGVVLLELLTGKRTMGDNGSESLTAWIKPYLSQRKPDLNLLVDNNLSTYSKAGAVKLAILAKHCIHDDPGYRPEMQMLAENLELVDVVDPTH